MLVLSRPVPGVRLVGDEVSGDEYRQTDGSRMSVAEVDAGLRTEILEVTGSERWCSRNAARCAAFPSRIG
jgi:hypothetical protein